MVLNPGFFSLNFDSGIVWESETEVPTELLVAFLSRGVLKGRGSERRNRVLFGGMLISQSVRRKAP